MATPTKLYVTTSDGEDIPVNSLAQTLAYDGSGNLTTITVVDGRGVSYVQTLTYSGGNLTAVSAWVRQ